MRVRELDIGIDVVRFPAGIEKERRLSDELCRPFPTLSLILASFHLSFQTFTTFFTILEGIPQSFVPCTASQYSLL
jgi:hypothetical protein